MIKFENTEVFNFEGAIRGMRNPLNSWELSDSEICPNSIGFEDCTSTAGTCPRGDNPNFDEAVFCIGKNDLALMKKLIKAGSDHRKFMRQIFVSVDITAPLYWWKEFDTYKVATVSNSCSTMHKIHDKKFTLEDFSTDHLIIDEDLTCFGMEWFSPRDILKLVIETLNGAREEYLTAKENGADGFTLKRYWWQMIQLLPSSYNQRRTITLNYETLYNIYGSRREHKLDEWRIGFMNWIKSLPYAEELIIDRS